MELAWLYTALALLVATLIFLLKNKKPEVDAGAAARPAPVQAGPGGRRQPRRLRQQVIFHVPKLLFCIMSQKICQGRSLKHQFLFSARWKQRRGATSWSWRRWSRATTRSSHRPTFRRRWQENWREESEKTWRKRKQKNSARNPGPWEGGGETEKRRARLGCLRNEKLVHELWLYATLDVRWTSKKTWRGRRKTRKRKGRRREKKRRGKIGARIESKICTKLCTL